MAVISGVLKGPMGDARVGVVIELRAVRTSATVVIQARSQSVTDATGRYTLSVEPGQYDVMITASGRQPERVGGIQVMVNSATGTLNDFLTIPGEADLNPAIVATVDQMRADAAASAAAAKTSENNAAATLANAVKKGEFGIGGITPLLTPATVMEALKTKQTGKYAVNNGSTGMPRGDVAYYLDWSQTAPSDGGHGFLLASALANKNTDQEGLYRNTLRSGDWQGWAKLIADESIANIIAPTMNSNGSTASYVKLAEQAPTAGNASGLMFAVSNGRSYGTVGIDYKIVYFSSRNATSSKLDARGIQVLSFGLNFLPTVNIEFGTLYNSERGMWELWMKGPSYNLPSVQLLGNSSGPSKILNGVTFGSSSTWQATMPAGYTPFTETKALSGYNTTVDANGFIKAASPIVKLFATGECELNDQSRGVTTERVSEGVYRISGTLGFNADAEWGGVDGGIEIPTDRNKLPLVWVDYEVDETGDLLVKTFHRVNSTAPKFAQNVKTGYKEGQPIDIPAGRWIDLRVEMPGGDEPEYEPVPENKGAPEVTPEVTEPKGDEEQAPGETPSPIEEPKE
ncbi:prophage tail fiber N-terminal domain-containing protein [Serratia fonticola]|uniref:prophage tail fiber N-terminal domain-containing protein n=1 Tax=Serratia fonticola TaxID=47917 RepID=UPI00211BF74F|nr:prophage tail fiber N-terminal domain-containing protein [Serratia fonticola]